MEMTVTLGIYHSNFVFTVVTKLKLGKLPCTTLVGESRPTRSRDKEEQSGEEEESLGQPVMCWKEEVALALLQACEKA